MVGSEPDLERYADERAATEFHDRLTSSTTAGRLSA
jgi:hypothetical protein